MKRRIGNFLKVAILACLPVLLLAGCATERHPGPLGAIGDIIEDFPAAKFILIALILGAGGIFKGGSK